jgi:hypothetical protein
MENRDRHYDPNVYVIRGIYTMQDLDFNLSQFGLFLNNDVIMVSFHLRSSFECVGRKIMSGDVLELPHLKDEYALNDSSVALRRFYVVQDVTRPTNGFSQTWYPHLIRAKCVPLIDSQEFKEILDEQSGDESGGSLRDLISTYKKNLEVNNQIIAEAELNTPKSGFDTTSYYVLPINPETGQLDIIDASLTTADASSGWDASSTLKTPRKEFYVSYLDGDGIPSNGAPYGFGITFPSGPSEGEYYLRTDFAPNRLFRFDGRNWVKFEDDVRMTLNNFGNDDVTSGVFAGKSVRQTLKTSFINNKNTATIAGQVVQERQALSKALKPKADY